MQFSIYGRFFCEYGYYFIHFNQIFRYSPPPPPPPLSLLIHKVVKVLSLYPSLSLSLSLSLIAISLSNSFSCSHLKQILTEQTKRIPFQVRLPPSLSQFSHRSSIFGVFFFLEFDRISSDTCLTAYIMRFLFP